METSVWRSDKIVFFEGEAKDSQQMHIDTKTDCAPSIHRRRSSCQVTWLSVKMVSTKVVDFALRFSV